MLTALKGNILEALSPDTLGIHPNSYLVLEDGRVAGIYPVLPDNITEAQVEDFGDALILQSFADMHLHGPQYEFMGTGMDRPLLQWLDTYAFPTEAKYSNSAGFSSHQTTSCMQIISKSFSRKKRSMAPLMRPVHTFICKIFIVSIVPLLAYA